MLSDIYDDQDLLEEVLSYWDQAGQRPYEVLIEQGLYEFFLGQLEKASLMLENKIYRGTGRHSQLGVGDILLYTYPTSWTYDLDTAKLFVEELPNGVILVFSSDQPIKAIENHKNTYREDEVIIHPLNLKVIKKYEKKGLTILEVSPQ